MYLTLLNYEQKKVFLGLAYNISNIDGDFSESEQQMIESYCVEMDIEYSDSDAKKDLETLLSNINSIFDNKTIKIVLFELVGIAMVDNKFDNSEREFLKKIFDLFEVDREFLNKAESLINSYIEVQNNINSLVIK